MEQSPVLEDSQVLESQPSQASSQQDKSPKEKLDALLASEEDLNAEDADSLFRSHPLLVRDLIKSGEEWPIDKINSLATGIISTWLYLSIA
jgi:hypothetical protein